MSTLDYSDVRTGKKCRLPFRLSGYAISLTSVLIHEPLNNETRAMLIEHLNESGESFAGTAIKGKGTVKCVDGIPTEIVCRASDWFRKPKKDGSSFAQTVCDTLPITVVTLEGLEPEEIGQKRTLWRGSEWEGDRAMWKGGNIPDELFDMIVETYPARAYGFGFDRTRKENFIAMFGWKEYETVLSVSALNVARRRAGLQIIKPESSK